MTKSEKREKIKNSRHKMGSSFKNFYQLMHIRAARLLKERGKIFKAG